MTYDRITTRILRTDGHIFKARCAAYANGQLRAPQRKQAWAFCDRSASLYQYLMLSLQAAELEHLEVLSAPLYACIGDAQYLCSVLVTT